MLQTTKVNILVVISLMLFAGCVSHKHDVASQKLQSILAISNMSTYNGGNRMVKNNKYGRVINDGASIEYAPVLIPPKMTPPNEEEYNENGWYRIAIQPAEPPEGKVVSSVTYAIEGNQIVAKYEYEDAPTPIRVFSKLKLEDELFKRGLLSTLDAFIDSQEITNEFGQKMPLRRKYDTALTFSDEHPLFLQFIEVAKQVLGIDDETAEEILDNSIAD